MSSPEHKQKIWNIIRKIKTGMLITEDDKALRARPMQLVQDEYDGTLYFYTRRDAGKVDEVIEDRQVCLAFQDSSEGIYVSLSGKAELSQDQDLIDRYWGPVVDAWFPEGKKDPSCAMLKIKISHGEHWENDTSSLKFVYEIFKSTITGEQPELGSNQKF